MHVEHNNIMPSNHFMCASIAIFAILFHDFNVLPQFLSLSSYKMECMYTLVGWVIRNFRISVWRH